MALSEPDRPTFDPKAHLQPSLGSMELEGKDFNLPSQQDFANPRPESPASMNASAHQLNSKINGEEIAPPITNGVYSDHTPTNETQNSFDPDSSVLGSADTAMTRESVPESSSQTAPEEPLSSEPLKLDDSLADPAPAVVQQPTSDVREEAQLEAQQPTTRNDMDAPLNEQPIAPDSGLGADEGTSAPAPLDETKLNDSAPAQKFTSTTEASQEDSALNQPENVEAPLASTDLAAEAPLDPAPTPAALDASSDALSKSEPTVPDEVMEDAPLSPSKIARPREEDESEEGPAAKRTRTDSQAPDSGFKVPERPQVDTQVSTSQPATTKASEKLMTKPQQKHIQRAIGNVKRIAAAKAFLAPVDYVTLSIPTYPEIIKDPMDLRTLEDNLRSDKYTTVEAVVADFNLIVSNAQTFNGPEHGVTKMAVAMKANFDKHMESLPSAEVKEAPSKKKAPDPMAIRAPPPRRESRSSLPGMAQSPASATSPSTFALGPEGTPLVRRNSTMDGRPKREIHKPPPRDLPYTHQKPKKKQYQWELKFCDHVLKEISKPKYTQYSFPFMNPVDAVALNIPTYHNVVKKPMDFKTIREKLDRGEYENAKEFEVDARQVFKNCYLFNPEGDSVNILGKRFEGIFNDEWNRKNEWLDENAPSSGQRSPASSDDEESEEEEEQEDEDEGQMEIVSKLQKQIAEMSKQVEMITSGTKKKQTPPVGNKKSAKPAKGAKKETKKAAPAQPKVDKKPAAKATTKKEKTPYVTYEQKQDISNRINSLTETKMTQALGIIRSNMPGLKGVQDDELELDIDELSNDVLYKLLVFVRKHAPRPDDSPVRPAAMASTAAPARKKNKPMSKHEQEARIAQVQSGLSAFQKGAAGGADDVKQSIENQGSDDDDEEDSESEEE